MGGGTLARGNGIRVSPGIIRRDDGTVALCTLRAATVLSRLLRRFWSSLKEGDVTAPLQTSIAPLTAVWKPHLYMGKKWGRFVIFPVLCLLAFGDSALQSQSALAFGHTKRGLAMTLLLLFFPSILVSWDPKYCKTRETQNDKSTLFPPPPPPHPSLPLPPPLQSPF